MNSPLENLTLQFLRWVNDRPRTYAETMDAWRTTCPRLTVWEDALCGGLIDTGANRTPSAAVTLTPLGREKLKAAEGAIKPSIQTPLTFDDAGPTPRQG